jgi:hypothetical protein
LNTAEPCFGVFNASAFDRRRQHGAALESSHGRTALAVAHRPAGRRDRIDRPRVADTTLAAAEYQRVIVLVRRAASDIAAHAKLALRTVDFANLPAPFPAVDDVYIALGTTIKTGRFAGGIPPGRLRLRGRRRQVPRGRPARPARGGFGARRQCPFARLLQPRERARCSRAIAGLGYQTLVIAQPSLLVGDRGALGQPVATPRCWSRACCAR